MGFSALIHTSGERATRAVGEALGRIVVAGDSIVLSGDLGAGKTQLTKGLAVGLGVTDPVTSPTFNILLVHEGRIPLYHFDLYRLDAPAQLEDLDYYATLEADGVSVIEWGDKFAEAAPLHGVSAVIHITGDDSRAIEVTAIGDRGREMARDWIAALAGFDGVAVETGGGS